jgi:hypothetical protein
MKMVLAGVIPLLFCAPFPTHFCTHADSNFNLDRYSNFWQLVEIPTLDCTKLATPTNNNLSSPWRGIPLV